MSKSAKRAIQFACYGLGGICLVFSLGLGLYGLGKFARSQPPDVEIKLKIGTQTEVGPLTKSLQSLALTPDYVKPSKYVANTGICLSGKRLTAIDGNNVVLCDLSDKAVTRTSASTNWHFTKHTVAELEESIVSEVPSDSTIKQASQTASSYSKAAFTISVILLAAAIIFGSIAGKLKRS